MPGSDSKASIDQSLDNQYIVHWLNNASSVLAFDFCLRLFIWGQRSK